MSALEQFEAGVSEVKLILGLDGASEPPNIDQDNALRRAAVVLLVSHFESYLKAIAEEFVDAIGTGVLESRQIPRGVRELHTVPKLTEILDTNDPTQREALLRKLQPITALWNDNAKPPPGTLSPRLVARQVTNAHSETIDALFKLMGSELDVCDGDLDIPAEADSPTVTSNIRYGLKDIVKCRNDIAHGDVDRKPTKEDVARYLSFLTALAERLQRKASALTALYAS